MELSIVVQCHFLFLSQRDQQASQGLALISTFCCISQSFSKAMPTRFSCLRVAYQNLSFFKQRHARELTGLRFGWLYCKGEEGMQEGVIFSRRL